MWSISAHPFILVSVLSLLWLQKMALIESTGFYDPFLAYGVGHPTKTMVTAMTFYF